MEDGGRAVGARGEVVRGVKGAVVGERDHRAGEAKRRGEGRGGRRAHAGGKSEACHQLAVGHLDEGLVGEEYVAHLCGREGREEARVMTSMGERHEGGEARRREADEARRHDEVLRT